MGHYCIPRSHQGPAARMQELLHGSHVKRRSGSHSAKTVHRLCRHWQRGLSSRGLQCVQVLASSWVTTRGGLVPKMLNPNVARGAANVASVRRLRNLVHGAIALKSLRALKVCLGLASQCHVCLRGCGPYLHQAHPATMTEACLQPSFSQCCQWFMLTAPAC